jgi:hypothetical protein
MDPSFKHRRIHWHHHHHIWLQPLTKHVSGLLH